MIHKNVFAIQTPEEAIQLKSFSVNGCTFEGVTITGQFIIGWARNLIVAPEPLELTPSACRDLEYTLGLEYDEVTGFELVAHEYERASLLWLDSDSNTAASLSSWAG